MKHRALAFITAFAAATPASAEWIFQEQGSAFDDAKMYMALTVKGNYIFGLRCQGSAPPKVLFLTPEALDEETARNLNTLDPEILVRVDSGNIIEIGSTVFVADGTLTLMGRGGDVLADELIAATGSVAVAARILGKTYHETEFATHEAKAVVTRFLDACPQTGS